MPSVSSIRRGSSDGFNSFRGKMADKLGADSMDMGSSVQKQMTPFETSGSGLDYSRNPTGHGSLSIAPLQGDKKMSMTGQNFMTTAGKLTPLSTN